MHGVSHDMLLLGWFPGNPGTSTLIFKQEATPSKNLAYRSGFFYRQSNCNAMYSSAVNVIKSIDSPTVMSHLKVNIQLDSHVIL